MRGDEVKKILEENGFQLAWVAEKLEISPQNFNNWLNVQDIKTGVLEKIAAAIEKNIYFFVDTQYLKNLEKEEFPEGAIRFYDLEALAGPIDMFNPESGIKFKKIIIPGYGDCDIAFKLCGNCMVPAINSGEIILCKEWKENFIDYGQAYLIVTNANNRMVRYLQPGNDFNCFQGTCENKSYAPIEINRKSIYNLYIVKGHIERTTI